MQTTALLAGVENHRVGRVAGDDGLTKIVRTFHARFGSVKTGAGQTPRQRIAYVRREGRHAVDVADVEATAGDKEKVLDAADRLEAEARIRRGPTADRLLATQVIELPAESTPEQRAKCAQAFVDDWRERGHPAIATVHVDGEERGQPHLHVEIAARPVHADGEVDRAVRLWRGKPTIYAERQKASDLVNRTCDPDPPYHPGGFRDIGREGDTPKKRIPAGSFHAARAEIRAAPEKAAATTAKMYATSRAERAPLRKAHEERTAVIIGLKAEGEWPLPSQRRRLQKSRDWERGKAAWRSATANRQRARADRAEMLAAATRVAGEHTHAELQAEAATLKAEKQQAETRADTAETSVTTLKAEKQAGAAELATARKERADAKNETAALRAHSAEQTKFLTGVHRESRRDLPDLETGEGRSEAWAFARAEIEAGRAARRREAAAEEKRKEHEAAASAERQRQAAAAQAEDEKQKAEGRVRELEAGTASGTEAAAVREAQPVPDAVPKPLDLPAAWTLPVDELIKAGDVVARKAAEKWGVADSSPTAMPLDGIDGVPVLTFTPVRGLFRKQPASWRYEDAGRYAGEAAIEIEQPDITDRNLDWPDWRAAGEALSRALVTDALEDGAETPRWLEEQFPDLDKKYGPKIRTRKYAGENPQTYVGEMSGGQPHGAGTTTWKSGDRYEGAFENGHRHGQGVYDYPNGNRYEGAWRDGLRHGQGIQTWSDGPRYEGAFENDARHGQGAYDFADGGRYEGGWRKGKQHGAGIVISPEGEITEGVWEDGKRVEAAAKKTQTRYRGPEMY